MALGTMNVVDPAQDNQSFQNHIDNKENPHGVTAEQVGAAAETHASQHKAGGTDALTPEDIGAQAKITGTAGDFLVIGDDGFVTTKTITNASGVSF